MIMTSTPGSVLSFGGNNNNNNIIDNNVSNLSVIAAMDALINQSSTKKILKISAIKIYIILLIFKFMMMENFY